MRAPSFVYRLVVFVVVLSLHLTALAPVLEAQEGKPVYLPLIGSGQTSFGSTDILYRTRVSVANAARWQRLADLGVTVLERGEGWSLVLADFAQLETLARLGFAPRDSHEFGALLDASTERQTLAGA